MSPIQKILFGSPGTGKSYKVNEIAENELGISGEKLHLNIVKTVFHPEYKYSDFMGKLLPLSSGNSITYKYYAGHFLKALAKAYSSIINADSQKYLLVIDELNRGNAAAIFGSVFQLLDRDENGWSSYSIDMSEMEMVGLLSAMGYKVKVYEDTILINNSTFENFIEKIEKNQPELSKNIKNYQIKMPPNLSIICTINTSDESIYYLDTAFKRRWDWEYIEAPCESKIKNYDIDKQKVTIPKKVLNTKIIINKDNELHLELYLVIVGINEFIKSCHKSIRNIEDKQIGWWFINLESEKLSLEQVRDKLMFYLWDSVFGRDKKPLIKLIEDKLNKSNVKLITYADFLKYTEELLEYWHDSVADMKNLEQATHQSKIKRTF
ncbi:restriction endonuclease [Calothrix sp. CCY 0018]|uniref:restriction endonuclease n=1 Tax=Calothrix sp. CCY 0018 TaxID=3103864 RepID=UPI0039C6B002